MKKLVTVENSVLIGLASNAKARGEFPFLSRLLVKGKPLPCGCARDRAAGRDPYNNARESIASMDSSRKRRLKEILGTERARVRYRNSAGKVIILTF